MTKVHGITVKQTTLYLKSLVESRTNYNEEKVFEFELKNFTVSFVNTFVCFKSNLRSRINFLINMRLNNKIEAINLINRKNNKKKIFHLLFKAFLLFTLMIYLFERQFTLLQWAYCRTSVMQTFVTMNHENLTMTMNLYNTKTEVFH